MPELRPAATSEGGIGVIPGLPRDPGAVQPEFGRASGSRAPEFGTAEARSRSSSVVFPTPLGPMSATRSGPRMTHERSPSPIVAMRRPAGTPGSGRSMRIASSSRTRRSAASSAVRAADSRSRMSVRILPAETCAARMRPPATIGGTRFSSCALRPMALRLAIFTSASMRSRFSRLTSCAAARSAVRAASCSPSSHARHCRVRSAEHREPVLVELGRVVHELEQAGVMADHDQRSAPAAQPSQRAAPAPRDRGCSSARPAA